MEIVAVEGPEKATGTARRLGSDTGHSGRGRGAQATKIWRRHWRSLHPGGGRWRRGCGGCRGLRARRRGRRSRFGLALLRGRGVARHGSTRSPNRTARISTRRSGTSPCRSCSPSASPARGSTTNLPCFTRWSRGPDTACIVIGERDIGLPCAAPAAAGACRRHARVAFPDDRRHGPVQGASLAHRRARLPPRAPHRDLQRRDRRHGRDRDRRAGSSGHPAARRTGRGGRRFAASVENMWIV
jgi:hypothetical protein